MQHILDAILAASDDPRSTPAEEFASLEIPDHYQIGRASCRERV